MSADRDARWCVIPVKGFERAKSRLASVLSESGRGALARDMFLNVHAASSPVANVLVATDDPSVEALAESIGARVILDGDSPDLATVVDRAIDCAGSLGARQTIVLMSDLPRLTTDDVVALVEATRSGACALAPDRAGTGTNALGTWLAPALRTRFGRPDSFAAHRAAAQAAWLDVTLIERPGLAFDLDTADDYAEFSRS